MITTTIEMTPRLKRRIELLQAEVNGAARNILKRAHDVGLQTAKYTTRVFDLDNYNYGAKERTPPSFPPGSLQVLVDSSGIIEEEGFIGFGIGDIDKLESLKVGSKQIPLFLIQEYGAGIFRESYEEDVFPGKPHYQWSIGYPKPPGAGEYYKHPNTPPTRAFRLAAFVIEEEFSLIGQELGAKIEAAINR